MPRRRPPRGWYSFALFSNHSLPKRETPILSTLSNIEQFYGAARAVYQQVDRHGDPNFNGADRKTPGADRKARLEAAVEKTRAPRQNSTWANFRVISQREFTTGTPEKADGRKRACSTSQEGRRRFLSQGEFCEQMPKPAKQKATQV